MANVKISDMIIVNPEPFNGTVYPVCYCDIGGTLAKVVNAGRQNTLPTEALEALEAQGVETVDALPDDKYGQETAKAYFSGTLDTSQTSDTSEAPDTSEQTGEFPEDLRERLLNGLESDNLRTKQAGAILLAKGVISDRPDYRAKPFNSEENLIDWIKSYGQTSGGFTSEEKQMIGQLMKEGFSASEARETVEMMR